METKQIFKGINENIIIKCFDDSMNVTGYVDEFRSLTWGYSWSGIGNWTIIADASSKHTIAVLSASTFIRIENIPSSFLVNGVQVVYGIMDKIQSQYKVSGDTVTFTGYELKALANRRIIRTAETYDDLKSSAVIEKLLYTQLVSPASSVRKIAGGILDGGSTNTETTDAPEQYTNVGDCITNIAEAAELGWHAIISDADGGVYWTVIDGKDRTLGQTVNEPMLLDFTTETIDAANYEVKLDDKNTAWVGGSYPDGSETRTVKGYYIDGESKTGIHRMEIFVDARNEEDSALQGKALEALNEYSGKTTIKITPSFSFLQHFGQTYCLGDIGTFTNLNTNMRLTAAELNFENNSVKGTFTFGYDKKTIKQALNILLRSYKNMLNY